MTSPTPPQPSVSVPPPDDKDWTWVLERPCDDCGFEPTGIAGEALPGLIREATAAWATVLTRPEDSLRERPTPTTWSPLEYACHVRDVNALFAERAGLILGGGGEQVQFANWDQDATAIERRYSEAALADVAPEVAQTGEAHANAYAGITSEQLGWGALRSNGSEFTLLSLGRYGLHDLHHHLWDVRAH